MTQPFRTTTIRGTLYDHPKYYDLVFGAGVGLEVDFLQGCFDLYAGRRVHRVFEPACGSGRLLINLAKRGFQVSGWDMSRAAVDYCNRRFERRGLPAPAALGDIVNVCLPAKVDAAFNLMSSFQILPTERAAEDHLRSMAANIAKGGLYILALHLTPSRGTPIQRERWAARRGKLSVLCRIWTKQICSRQRKTRCGMVTEARTPRSRVRIVEDCAFRTYSAAQIGRLFEKIGHFEPVATYDYGHDLDDPIIVDDRTQDVVYVLRRR
ncbi:class I SAM-dependent methyltransferase [Bradyrhizobium sp.]|jgi:SAM-dependent methyltransferase|uniref:class I SAM-dependent methyltransferase n=1 Tax=Bradyrhizobium sp. TaxID=376 RepID=UPI002DDD3FAD|nr:class I SAM-dependent methyltransferase [Bradyrhizobium sp.]HEV2159476.1 class I SAM-dependent methyltransferase [Bradyrhizobium sp.]